MDSALFFMTKNVFKLIVGLGNPGDEYKKNRHNSGFMTADYMSGKLGLTDIWRAWQNTGLYCEFDNNGEKVYILKPQTYMNLSGRAVQSLASFYKIQPSQILIIYDDLALPFGKIRIRKDGSAGSHNGMSSVITCVGSNEIPRIRIGIGPRPSHIQGKDYVLGNFTKDELSIMPDVLDKAFNAVKTCLEKDIDTAMNIYNS